MSVARLGIVSPIAEGEHIGWFMGTGGFIFVAIGACTGHLTKLYGSGDGRPDIVPADFTVDGMIGVCAATIERSKLKNRKVCFLL